MANRFSLTLRFSRPTQLWNGLNALTKQRMLREFARSCGITPWMNDCILFSSMVEAANFEFNGTCDRQR
jgi:hypothetical protein